MEKKVLVFSITMILTVAVFGVQQYDYMNLDSLQNLMSEMLEKKGYSWVLPIILKDDKTGEITFKFDFLKSRSEKDYAFAINVSVTMVGVVAKKVTWKIHPKIYFTQNSLKTLVAWFYTEDAKKIPEIKDRMKLGKFVWTHIHWKE